MMPFIRAESGMASLLREHLAAAETMPARPA
jgi:hypothetical protein